MEQLPEFWRAEVFHPLSVHFPIAFLFLAFIFKMLSFWAEREVWELGGSILLFLGTIGAWAAIFTGDIADGEISRRICDPTVLKDHENVAYLTAWFFTASSFLEFLRFFRKSVLILNKKGFRIIILLLMAGGTGSLFYTGHLGASLVYQQGAGVNIPSSDCADFQ